MYFFGEPKMIACGSHSKSMAKYEFNSGGFVSVDSGFMS